MPKIAPGAAFYDTIYKKHRHYRRTWRESRYAKMWGIVIDLLKAHGSKTILDVGCGTGQFAAMLGELAPTIQYTGFDFSPEAVAVAKKLAPAKKFFVGDARNAKSYAHPYDTVVCTEALEHLDDDLNVFKHLVKGSYCIFTVPNGDAKGHVRFFPTLEEVIARYQHNFEELHTTSTRNDKSIWWIGHGKLKT